MTFDAGIPDFESLLVTDYGLAQLRHFYEDGEVLLYVGGNKHIRVPGKTKWRYANY